MGRLFHGSHQKFDVDMRMLNLGTPLSAKDQQALEALAILVALRVWKRYWTSTRLTLAVFTDNMAALALVAKMQPHSPQLGARVSLLSLGTAQGRPQGES